MSQTFHHLLFQPVSPKSKDILNHSTIITAEKVYSVF